MLKDAKNKVLDAAQVEKLESAYRMLEKNLDQLKENNHSLLESNQILKEQIKTLNVERTELANKLKEAEKDLAKYARIREGKKLGEMATRILSQCMEQDAEMFTDSDMIKTLGCSRIAFSTAIDELTQKTMVINVAGNMETGETDYGITAAARQFMSENLS